MKRISLLPDTAEWETVAAKVAVLRANIAATEGRVASVVSRARRTWPEVATWSSTVQQARTIIVEARVAKVAISSFTPPVLHSGWRSRNHDEYCSEIAWTMDRWIDDTI